MRAFQNARSKIGTLIRMLMADERLDMNIRIKWTGERSVSLSMVDFTPLMVAVAQCRPEAVELLLADEPTGNLHSSQGEMIMDVFKQLHQEGMTIVQVTHNEKYAQYGTRIIELMDGFVSKEISL